MHRLSLYLVICIIVVGLVASASAQNLSTVYAFKGGTDGGNPSGWLIADAAGDLYGTSTSGGQYQAGTVFELIPPKTNGGAWTETVLYSFHGGSNDGSTPWAGLTFDKAGNLYGSTFYGGPEDCGSIFVLQPTGQSGTWTETVLHFFDGTDGVGPNGVLVGQGGALFGATLWGNNIFRLALGNDGQWHFENLYTFQGTADGEEPLYNGGPLVEDAAGNLYGVMAFGGAGGAGNVFELVRPASGSTWTPNILYSFTGGDDGVSPLDSLLFYKGNIYGTAAGGGAQGYGVVFELSPSSTGWTESVLYNFQAGIDGQGPRAALIHDGLGNLYGTTYFGGAGGCNDGSPGCGTVFKLKNPGESGGPWTETAVQRFSSATGIEPYARVLGVGNRLFGTLYAGGNSGCYDNDGCGVVFEITP